MKQAVSQSLPRAAQDSLPEAVAPPCQASNPNPFGFFRIVIVFFVLIMVLTLVVVVIVILFGRMPAAGKSNVGHLGSAYRNQSPDIDKSFEHVDAADSFRRLARPVVCWIVWFVYHLDT